MYERFEELLLKHDITAYRVSKETGITTATFSSWKQGRYTPKQDKLQKIAEYFNVSIDYLLGHTDDPTPGPRQLKLFKINEDEADYFTERETEIRSKITLISSEISEMEKHIYSIDTDTNLDYSKKISLIKNLKKTIEHLENERDALSEESSHPYWATTKDKRDLKKILEEDAPLMFDGVPIEGDSKQRVIDVLTGLFWEAREMNKKTYGRKKESNESNDK
jgi:Helix-turn-helix.